MQAAFHSACEVSSHALRRTNSSSMADARSKSARALERGGVAPVEGVRVVAVRVDGVGAARKIVPYAVDTAPPFAQAMLASVSALFL